MYLSANDKLGLKYDNVSLGDMDMMNIDPQLVDLGIRLSEAGARNTVSAIFDKIRAARAKKGVQETVNELEEIINDLISDKNELVQIAQAYKQELVAQQISKKDIEYITEKFIPILKNLLKQTSSVGNVGGITDIEKTIDSLTPLLSVEMLTVLQLVGFNFKQAIGEPLTLWLQKLITSKIPTDPQSNLEYNKLAVMLSTEALKVVQDKDTSERLEQLKSKGIL
jgi:hypothetical protein